jgi:hypothetical protein
MVGIINKIPMLLTNSPTMVMELIPIQVLEVYLQNLNFIRLMVYGFPTLMVEISPKITLILLL